MLDEISKETWVISPTDEGYRVYSPANPTKSYVVSGNREEPICSCDPERSSQNRCVHITAVLEQLLPGQGTKRDPYELEERRAIQEEGRDLSSGISHMLIKRSVSPDGKIDSLSVEFSSSVESISAEEIRKRAMETLKLQAEIATEFKNGNHSGQQKKERPGGTIPAKMVNVDGMPGKWGRRLFINVQVNGQTSRIFGNRKQLSERIADAGYAGFEELIMEGRELGLPCKVVTEPSPDGRFLNIVQVMPAKTKGAA